MAWKTEKWMEEIFPGASGIYSEYVDLPPRELAIVTSAVLDAALAELLAQRFLDYPTEYESFLGVNGDGRAPAASFGARIQLALLVGIITQEDASVLRAIKNIRNTFAHRVNASFTDEPALGQVRSLLEACRGLSSRVIDENHKWQDEKAAELIAEDLDKSSSAGQGLLIAMLAIYQAYFHRLKPLVRSVDLVKKKS